MNLFWQCMVCLAVLGCLPLAADAQTGLTYSGQTEWDAASGTLTFTSDGEMPDTKEGFFWLVPSDVKHIIIGSHVTVTGGFRIPLREPKNPLTIEGKDRKTSVITGTSESAWTTKHAVPDTDKWKYGAVCVMADAVVNVQNLTAKDPRGYIISGVSRNSVIHVNECDLLDTRPGENNNSDGFVGGVGSTIRNTFIGTGDDAIKVYNDITIENVTIEQHRNGAPLQLGWAHETGTVTAHIKNLSIWGVDQSRRYNMCPISWEGGSSGSRTLVIDGLFISVEGEKYSKQMKKWEPVGIFHIVPTACTFDMRAENATIQTSAYGLRSLPGKVTINGTTERRNKYLPKASAAK